MDVNIRTEELTTIFLDSEDDEDPLRLSPPPSPVPSTSNALMNQVRQRFANLRNSNAKPALSITTVDKIMADAPHRRIAPKKIGDVRPKVSEVIEVIDLDPDSPPRIPGPSTSTTSSPRRVENGSPGSRLRLWNRHNVSNHSGAFASTSKGSSPSGEDNSPASPSTSKGSGQDRETNGSTRSKPHGGRVSDQVLAVASTSKENGQNMIAGLSSSKKSKPESNLPVVALLSKESGPSRVDHSPAVASTSKEYMPSSVEHFAAVASTSNEIRPGRELNFPANVSTSKEKRPGGEKSGRAGPASSKKNRPCREEIDLTMSKLIEHGATNSNIFNKFMEICVACDNSPAVKAIHAKKTTRYYENLQPDYKDSEVFRSLLEENISIMAKNPASVYTCLINVHAEMKRKRFVANGTTKHSVNYSSTTASDCTSLSHVNEPLASSMPLENNGQALPTIDGLEDSKEARKRMKTEKHIKNLEKASRRCNLRIKQLEEAEVDWDDEEDSSYMKLQRYRRRCIDIHRKIVELTGVRDDAIKRRARVACMSPYPNVAAAIERYVFQNATFPDFNDILKIYREAKITGLRQTELHDEAKKTFQEIGDQIQRDRQLYDWNLACTFLEQTTDPAEEDPELKLKLKHNKQLGDSKLDEVMASFTRKQYEQHLEPAEVTDEQAAATDDEDDDEEDEEEAVSDDNDVGDGLGHIGEDGSGDDSDENDTPSSNSSRNQSQEKQSENKGKKDKKKLDKKSSGTRNPDLPSTGFLWSFTEEAKMKAAMNVLTVKVDSPAPQINAEFTSPQTKLPLQTQLTPTTEKFVNPLRKYQLETLTNYLEMKYHIDPSVINGKLVSSSSSPAESLARKRPGSPSAIVDSTESKTLRRCERTGSDPEVTSTSVDGDLALENRVFETGQNITETSGSVLAKMSQPASSDLATRRQLTSSYLPAKVQLLTGGSSTMSYISSGDSPSKKQLGGEDSASRRHLGGIDSPAKIQLLSGGLSSKHHIVTGDTLKKSFSASTALAVTGSTAKNDKFCKASFSEVHSSYVFSNKVGEQLIIKHSPDNNLRIASSKTSDDIFIDPVASLAKDATNEVKVCGRESGCVVNVKKIARVCRDSVTSEKGKALEHSPFSDTEQEELDLEEEMVEEETMIAKEARAEEESMSTDEGTADLEDWENMIIPTMVAKEVLLVPTDVEGEPQGTEVETSADIDLDSSDEYLQSPPVIKTYQQKGRDIVLTRNEETTGIQSETSESKQSLPEAVAENLPQMVMIKRNLAPTIPGTGNIDMPSMSASMSASTALDLEGSENVQPSKPAFEPKGQENVPPRKVQVEKSASKGITYTIQSKPKIRELEIGEGISKTGKAGSIVYEAGSSHSSSLLGAGTLELENLTPVDSDNQLAQALLLLSSMPVPVGSSYKPTARKTIGGGSHPIKTRKPTECSESFLTVNPAEEVYSGKQKLETVGRITAERITSVSIASVSGLQAVNPVTKVCSSKEKAVALSSEISASVSVASVGKQGKPRARKSVQGEKLGTSFMQAECLVMDRLKDEPIQSGDKACPVKSSVPKVVDHEIIIIDSD